MRAACVLSLWLLSQASPAPSDDMRAIRRAIALLPKVPSSVTVNVTVTVMDADDAKPDVRERLLTLDAFITRGGHVIYVVKQSAVLKGAAKGSRVYDHVLAGILWH